MNLYIRRYIDQAPEAISGSGGHMTTLRVARCLFNGFGLDRQEVFEGLKVYNSRLADKWTDRELMHKADSAASGTYDKPSGWMLPATDATAPSYSQPSLTRARAHAQASQESEISVASVPESGEAERIAGELVKLHRDGAIKGTDDPEAGFYAQVIHIFGGTYLGRHGTHNV
jgi:hypothetical protein